MRRLHLVELEDLPWCPQVIRKGITDYLECSMAFLQQYRAILPRLTAIIERSHTRKVVDLCSGSGGPWLWAKAQLGAPVRDEVEIHLTDKFPDERRFESIPAQKIFWECDSVDATHVPKRLAGVRTMFTAFHHFRPEEARRILSDAARAGQSIGVFEVTERRWPTILFMLTTPIWVWIATPFIRPFRWSRLFFTYVIPAIPFAAMFDGVVSCLRTYSPEELSELTSSLEAKDYSWEVGREKIPGVPMAVIYLLGQSSGRESTLAVS